ELPGKYPKGLCSLAVALAETHKTRRRYDYHQEHRGGAGILRVGHPIGRLSSAMPWPLGIGVKFASHHRTVDPRRQASYSGGSTPRYLRIRRMYSYVRLRLLASSSSHHP